MQTYFLTGREGFYKPLPDPDSYERTLPELWRSDSSMSNSHETDRHHAGQSDVQKDFSGDGSVGQGKELQGDEGRYSKSNTTGTQRKSDTFKAGVKLVVQDFCDDVSDDGSDAIAERGEKVDNSSDDQSIGDSATNTSVSSVDKRKGFFTRESHHPENYVNHAFDHDSSDPPGSHFPQFQEDGKVPSTCKTTVSPKKMAKMTSSSPSLKVTDLFLSPLRHKKIKHTGIFNKSYLRTLTSSDGHLSRKEDHGRAGETTTDKNPLEYLFSNPKAADSNNASLTRSTARQLDLTSNIFPPLAPGLKFTDERLKCSNTDDRSSISQFYGQHKMENTEHRNSPLSSRSSLPKLDIGLFKDQVTSRMLKATENTPV